MRYTDPNVPDTVEEHLRRENETLRAEIEALGNVTATTANLCEM